MPKEVRYKVALNEAGEFTDSFRCSEETIVEVKRLLASELSETDERRELLLRCHHFSVDKMEKLAPDRRTPQDTIAFVTCGVTAGLMIVACALVFGIGVATVAGWVWR